MSKFTREYENKKITIREALSLVKSNDLIWTSYNGLEPEAFLRELHTVAHRVENVSLRHAGLWRDYDFISKPEMQGHFSAISSFYDAFARDAHDCRISSYIPLHLHNGCERTLEDRHANIFVGMCSPMDEHGYVRFALCVLNEMDAVFEADKVVMLINPNLPTVAGNNQVHIRDIDYVVEVDDPAIIIGNSEPTEVEMRIGAHIGSLVQDGSTIQLGIGNIPNAIGKYLADKNDLGVHTEMITSVIAELAEARVITGKRKTIDRCKIVGNFALGSKQLYDYMDDNPEIALMSGSYTNDPRVISSIDNMVSINTCLQVDVTGQVCSESIGPRQYSGTGGAADFAVGASNARSGKAIVAVRSTAKKGTVSTIQPMLTEGAVVSISRNDVDYIVTEFGIAKMKGQTIAQRVENLIAVAHPDFRDEIRAGVERWRIW